MLIIACQVMSMQALSTLFLVGKFPYANQMYIVNQITGLIDRGHTITVLSQTRMNEEYCLALKPYTHKLCVLYESLPDDKKKYDVILCQMADLGTWLLQLKQQGLMGKSVVFCRGWDLSSLLRQDPHRYDYLFSQTDLWLPVCGYFRQSLLALGYDPSKLKVLGSSIDCGQFKRNQIKNKNKHIRIVTTARLVPKKGIEYALRAIADLSHSYSGIEYIIIGDGQWKERLETLSMQLGMHDRVEFVGQQTHGEIVQWLHSADMYIQPSLTSADHNQEGIPNALKEAMAMELPVISTLHAGIPELIDHGISGLLVPEKDAYGLKNALMRLINDKHMRNRLGKAAREKVIAEYDIDNINDQLHELLLLLCKGSHV